MRLPNVFTAMADILAGYFIVTQGRVVFPELGLLLAASSCLYTGGIVLNDYFDFEIDRRERPGRPLPSGRVSRNAAGRWGWGLTGVGILFGFAAGPASFVIALGIALSVISYDTLTKGIAVIGPVNMGFCRYLNVTLGMSPVFGGTFPGFLLLVPLVMMAYITTLTFLARMEAGSLKIQRGIKWMLLGIIPLDAVIATVGAGPGYGAMVLVFLVPAFILSKILYMT
jgi:4-hydroxybenzoate polyprenyltransferase